MDERLTTLLGLAAMGDEDDDLEDDDLDEGGFGSQAGWDPGAGQTGGTGRM